MGIVVVPTFGADPVTITGPTLDAKVDGIATEFNGQIDNDNIKSAAAIANSKLNLASISQDVTLAGTNVLSGTTTLSGVTTMSSKILKLAKGADVASAAGAITLGDDGNYFDITGTAAITSITAKTAGTVVRLQFDSTASLVDGSNLKLAGNFQGAAESTIELVSDGTNWFEIARSPATTFTPSVTNALSGSVIQHVYASIVTVVTTTTTIPNDDSIPQSGEGVEVTTLEITPNHASNRLIIRACVPYDAPVDGSVEVLALFQDATAGALACSGNNVGATAGPGSTLFLQHEMAAGTTSATTFKIRIGSSDNNTLTVNGDASGRKYGGVLGANISIMEIKA
jgi:hypothetical protein